MSFTSWLTDGRWLFHLAVKVQKTVPFINFQSGIVAHALSKFKMAAHV